MILQIKRAKFQSDEEGKEGKNEMEERVTGERGRRSERERGGERGALTKGKRMKLLLAEFCYPQIHMVKLQSQYLKCDYT